MESPFKNRNSKYCSSVADPVLNIQETSKGSDQSVLMLRLVSAFPCRSYHIVGNLMLWRIYGPP